MNKFNKGKSIGIVAASLAAVSLMGVGFATWIIGTRTTDANNDISIVADDVQYKSLKVSVKFTNTITLAETGKASSSDYFSYDGNGNGNLKVKANFTFTFGKDFTADDYDFTKIHFSIEDATTGFVDNKVASDAVLIKRDNSTNLTYFDAPADFDFSKTGLGDLSTLKGNDLTFTKTVDQEIEFTWGSMFDKKSPLTYYNAEIAKDGVINKDEFSENAYRELNAMKTKYKSDPKIKLKIELQKEKE